MSRNEISKLIGVVFLEKCAVNLLSTVLDTPEFFWDAPDSLQGLYDALCEYLEMEDRVQVRFPAPDTFVHSACIHPEPHLGSLAVLHTEGVPLHAFFPLRFFPPGPLMALTYGAAHAYRSTAITCHPLASIRSQTLSCGTWTVPSTADVYGYHATSRLTMVPHTCTYVHWTYVCLRKQLVAPHRGEGQPGWTYVRTAVRQPSTPSGGTRWRTMVHWSTLQRRLTVTVARGGRPQVLNARFEVLHPMLDVLRDHQNTEHRSGCHDVVRHTRASCSRVLYAVGL